jgi:O-antigen ligase
MVSANPKPGKRAFRLKLRPISIRRPDLQTVDECLFFLLFLAFSIPFRFPFGSYTIGLAEPVTLVFILWRLLALKTSADGVYPSRSRVVKGFWIFAAWIAVVWVLSNDWKDRREALLGWGLAAALITVLLWKPPKDWRRIAILFVVTALPNIIAGILQYFLGIGMPPKDLSGWRNADATIHPVVGFFGHSNDFAVYLYWPFVLSLGLALEGGKKSRIFFGVIAVLSALIIYWTVSRTIILTIIVLGFVFLLMLCIRRRKLFGGILLAIAGFAAAGVVIITQTRSAASINVLLSGRWEFWRQIMNVILSDPLLLPAGYLGVPPADFNILWLPHNIFLYAWLNYGFVGLFLLIGLIVYIVRIGWKRYDSLRTSFFPSLLWLGMSTLLLVNGLASLYLHENYIILTFICILAIAMELILDPKKINMPPPGSA